MSALFPPPKIEMVAVPVFFGALLVVGFLVAITFSF
jgi:hypothetical protein